MKQTPTGLIIVGDVPKSEEERPLMCGLCGARWRMDQMPVYERHMARCGNSDLADMAAATSPRRVAPMFDPQTFGDVEYGQWFRKRRKAIFKGIVKP